LGIWDEVEHRLSLGLTVVVVEEARQLWHRLGEVVDRGCGRKGGDARGGGEVSWEEFVELWKGDLAISGRVKGGAQDDG
jgi:hypothetical protein